MSKIHALPLTIMGTQWVAERLNKVGVRAGMKCIYKIRKTGQSKRAGVYLQGMKTGIAGRQNYVFNIAGAIVEVDSNMKTISCDPLLDYLIYDKNFANLCIHTLSVLKDTNISTDDMFNKQKVTTLSDKEIEAIDHFGVF